MNSNILNLIKLGESETLEFKPQNSKFASVAQSVCALINQQGGSLIWGINKQGTPVGIEDAQRKKEDLSKYLMTNINPIPYFSLSIQEAKQVQIIVVRIPMGYDKPYSANHEIWVRIGRKTMRAGENISTDLVQQKSNKFQRWEREPMPGFSLDYCDLSEIKQTRDEIANVGRFGIDVPNKHDELLRRLYLQRSGLLTNAAVVLFASAPRRWSPNLYLRIVSYGSDKMGPVANDTILEGPAVRVLKDSVAVIQQRTGFSGRFNKEQLEREDRPAYPLYVIREALVNAITHRSYDSLGGCVRVDIYPDYIVVSNPGYLPAEWTTRKLQINHPSVPFNPDVTRVFYLRKYMDQLGVGTQRMIQECKKIGAKSPSWIAKNGLISVTIYRAPEPSLQQQLSSRQNKALNSVNTEEFTAADYARMAGVSARQARRDIAELEKLDLIKRRGKGKATVYSINKKEL